MDPFYLELEISNTQIIIYSFSSLHHDHLSGGMYHNRMNMKLDIIAYQGKVKSVKVLHYLMWDQVGHHIN